MLIMSVFFSKTSAQEIKTISLTYKPSDFTLIERNNLLYIDSKKYSYTYNSDTLAPALPFIGIYVWIDNKFDYVGCNVNSEDILLRKGLSVAPNIESCPMNDCGTVNLHEIDYLSNIYPVDCVEFIGENEIGGNKILCFSISPFQYFPNSKELFFKDKITLNISLSLSSTSLQRKKTNATDLIDDLVVNRDEMYAARKIDVGLLSRQDKSLETSNCYEYLIVTCDSLKEEFQRLADWKTMKGVRAKVITTDSIFCYSTEIRPQLQIKKAIMDYYENSNNKLKYVLLGGDHEIVPAEHCRVILKWDDTTEEQDIPTDLYYSSLKKLNWDSNNNGVIGELIDNIDISHDIYVTRLSVNTVSDARNQIRRIIKYEMNPDTCNWTNTILMAGKTLSGAQYNYAEGIMSDTHYKSEKFYQKYIYRYWPTGMKYMFYDTGTSFPGGAQYHFRKDNVAEQLSNGYTISNVVTHGETDSWEMESRTDMTPQQELFYTSDASLIDSKKNSFIITPACKVNAFSSADTSLSEGFMRNPNGGIIGFYGSSTYCWYYRDSLLEDPSETFIGTFYTNLFKSNRHQMGKAIYDSKFSFRYLWSHYMWRSFVFGMNGLCDPEMSVFLSTPQRFNDVNVQLTNGILTVTTGVPDCRICVMSKNDFGDSYYFVVDSTQSESFHVPTNAYIICITKTGFIPYIAQVGDTIYIQNEEINTNTTIIANHTFIGDNVSQDITYGPVTVTEGSTLRQYSGDVTIARGFEVKKGAQLEINSNGN